MSCTPVTACLEEALFKGAHLVEGGSSSREVKAKTEQPDNGTPIIFNTLNLDDDGDESARTPMAFPKKKMPQLSSTANPVLATQKMIQNREKEKLRRFHKPIPLDQRPAQGTSGKDKSGGTLVASLKDVEENMIMWNMRRKRKRL